MNTRTRGLIVFAVIVFVAVVFCGLIPFVVMPANGFGVGLPVIEVPGEVVVEDFLPGFNLTNTIIGTVLADVILVIFVILVWRSSKGWTKEVPGRLQALAEAMIEGIYGFFKGLAGDRLRTAPLLWPLVATIFIFLLAANWMKLFPGVETVGKMHCAYEGQSGYAMLPGWTSNSYRLWVDTPLNAGTTQTAETEAICNDFFKYKEFTRFQAEPAEAILVQLEEAEAALPALTASLEAAEDEEATLAAEDALSAGLRAVERQQLRLEAANALPQIEANIAFLDELLDQVAEADSFTRRDQIRGQVAEAVIEAANESSAVVTREGLQISVLNDVESVEMAADVEEFGTRLEDLKASMEDLRDFHLTQMQFPTATIVFNESQLETNAVPFIFHITPFVRGAATDLSLTFALAIMSIVLVQVYGVWALGPAYFEKFINISALGNLGKKPLGLVDFVVGLFEIISEFGKIVSLAFRLFGNLFAGGVALIAVTFLVAMLIPGVIVALEIIIGGVQALVFAVLTLVFAVQAMEGHHGDEHEEHH